MSEIKPVVNPVANPPHDDEIDLRALMSQVWYNKLIIGSGLGAGLVIALIYLFLATPIYSSDALLQLDDDNRDFGLLSEMMISSGVDMSTQSEKEILTSRTILGGAIEELRLDVVIEPHYMPLIGKSLAKRYQGSEPADASLWTSYAWGGEQLRFDSLVMPRAYLGEQLTFTRLAEDGYRVTSGDGETIFEGRIGSLVEHEGWQIKVSEFKAREGTSFFVQKQHLETAINNLRSLLVIKQLGGNRSSKDIIALELEGEDPHQAAEILNIIIKHYIRYKIGADTAAADKTLAFLQQQLDKYASDPTFNPQLYMQMSLKAQELKVMTAGELGNVRVIDYPLVPLRPAKPRKALVAVLGTLLGGLLSLMWVVLRISMDRAIYNPKQIETYLNLPVYATVPMSPNQAKLDKQLKSGKSLLYQNAHDDPAIEAMRFLRTSMETGNLRIRNHSVIGITGPSPDVGKSFISANLSSLITELGSKVLLIDGDIRKGVLHDYFHLPKGNGLADYLAGRVGVEDIIKYSGVGNLDVITRGELPGNPSVLMNSSKLEELLEQVKPHYNFVFIDTPPALSVTDAAVVARYCDRLVIVLRAGKTTIEEVSTCWNRLSNSGVTPSGLVMSGFDVKSHGYGIYRHYGYY